MANRRKLTPGYTDAPNYVAQQAAAAKTLADLVFIVDDPVKPAAVIVDGKTINLEDVELTIGGIPVVPCKDIRSDQSPMLINPTVVATMYNNKHVYGPTPGYYTNGGYRIKVVYDDQQYLREEVVDCFAHKRTVDFYKTVYPYFKPVIEKFDPQEGWIPWQY